MRTVNFKNITSFARISLELIFIWAFLYSPFYLSNNSYPALRIWIATLLIFILFTVAKFCLDKKNHKNLFSLTILFFIAVSAVQTIKNIYAPQGLPVLGYEIIHYILAVFVLSYNFKEKRFLETGLVLFIVYSFRIFDFHLADNEFMLIHSLTLILALIWLEAVYAKDKILPMVNSIFVPLTIFMIIVIFSVLNAVCPYKSLGQAVVMLNFIFVGFLIATSLRDIRQVNLLILTFLLIGGVLIILAMNEVLSKFLTTNIQYALNQIFIGRIGKQPPTIHVNSIAGYFIVLLCLIIGSLSYYKSGTIRLTASFLIIVMSIILGLTYSRFGILSFMVALTVLSAFRYKKFINFVRTKLVFLILSAVFIITIIALSPIKKNIVNRLLNDFSSDCTFYSCKITLDAINDNPLFGVGFENYYLLSKYAQKPIARYYSNKITLDAIKDSSLYAQNPMITPLNSAVTALKNTRDLTRSAPHSLYLGIAFGLGVIGLAVFIWLLISFILYCLKLNNYMPNGYEKGLLQGIFVAFISVIFHGILSMTFHLTILPAFFWISIGLAIAIGNITDFNKKINYELKPWKIAAFLIIIVSISIGIVINPAIAERYYISALNDFNSGRLNEAIRKIDRANTLVPVNPKFYELTSEIQIKQGLIDAAIESYKKALRFKQSYAFYHTRLGQLYQQKLAYAYALKEFNMAIILDKYGAYPREHYSDLGLLYEVMGKKEEAVDQFKKAVLIDPEVARDNSWGGLKYLDELLNRIHQDYKFEQDKNPLIAQQIWFSLKAIYRYRGESDKPRG